jgi:hypothetical protein
MKGDWKSGESVTKFGTVMAKEKAFKWEINDNPGEFRLIDKGDIKIDHEYQRVGVSNDKINMFASSWSWISCGVLIVARRADEYYVVDGQHRLLAANKVLSIRQLPCLVFPTTTKETEAIGFLNVNRNRKGMQSVDAFRAALVAGDETSIYVKEVFDTLGIIAKATGQSPGTIKCVALAVSLAGKDKDIFRLSLKLCNDLCKDKKQIPEHLLGGVAYLVTKIKGGASKKLISRMYDIGMEAMLDGISHARSFHKQGGVAVYADGILMAINKGLQYKYELK